jgi:CHAT domain-containing protein/Tfp pilus assembly protein PilF
MSPNFRLAVLVLFFPAVSPAQLDLQTARQEQQRLHDLERYDEAQEAGRRWIALVEKAGDTKQLAEAHFRTSKSFLGQRKFEPSVAHLQKSLEQLQMTKDPELEAAVRIDLGRAEANLSRYSSALDELSRAEALLKEKPVPALVANVWSVRATVAVYRGEQYEALSLFERANELAVKAADKKLLGTIFINWGQTQMALQQYADALVLYERALETDLASPNRVIALVSIGICHYEMNQFVEAERVFEEARQLAVRIGSPALEAWALGELGLTAWKTDSHSGRAEQYFDRSITLYEKSGDRRNALAFMSNKAVALRDRGRYLEALKLYREVERKTLLIPGQKPSPALYKGMGQTLAALGRSIEGEAMLAQAIRAAQSAGDTKRVWEGNRELARLYRSQGRFQGADAAYQSALSAIESVRQSLRLGGFKTDFFEDKVQIYDEYAGFLFDHLDAGQGTRRAFEVTERARARSLLDSLVESRTALEETLPVEVAQKEKAILAQISEIQAETRRGGSSPERKGTLNEKEKELQDFYVRVRTEHPRFREMRYPEPARLEAVQKALRPDEALLAYALGEKTSYLWFVAADRIRAVSLPAESVIEGGVRPALGQLVTPQATPDLESLAGLLLKPVEAVEKLPRSLIIVPSGILHYFPFELLLNATHAVSYVPSATMLVSLRAHTFESAKPRLLALADSLYSKDQIEAAERSAAAGIGVQNLGALPHTRKEVQSIRSVYGRLHSTVLLGRNATEDNLKAQDVSRYSVIHLATHGWIDSALPSRSGLILGIEPGSREDGILEVREIFGLSLRADLVTLSACQSGLGKLVTGEGMTGLTHAFFYAGARSVVATLWNVSDEASAEFMSAFYTHLERGESKAEALRLAKADLSNDPRYRHPYFWAPYILVGEGSDAVSFPETWWVWPLAGGFVFVAVGFIVYRKRSQN